VFSLALKSLEGYPILFKKILTGNIKNLSSLNNAESFKETLKFTNLI